MKTIMENGKEYVLLKSMNYNFGITKNAEIKNFITGRVLRPYIGSDCYEHVILHMNGKKYRKRVHRLMAEAFFNNAKNIDHIDNNKSNNKIENLTLITTRKNIEKGIEDAKNFHTNVGWFKSLKIEVIHIISGEKKFFDSLRQCEKYTGVDRHRIKTFIRNERPNYTEWLFHLCGNTTDNIWH